jgi:hypothetical protein
LGPLCTALHFTGIDEKLDSLVSIRQQILPAPTEFTINMPMNATEKRMFDPVPQGLLE